MSDSTNRPEPFSFPEMERDILAFWTEHDTFQKSLDQTRDSDPYTFYDGPPFATGLPHHGNLLASVIKDVVPRYWTMKGRHVSRRFGWDCHGLPIEHEIDKKLGMSAHEALQNLGVAGYNDECRAIVDRYTNEWRSIISRIGRWVDFDNQYKTMDVWFMESVWWVVKQLWDRELIYPGYKVMPVSTALETPLSNFEATSNYKDVQDPAITVLFKLNDEDAYISAWTTTPWTLPSNLALCVGEDISYVLVLEAESQRKFFLAEDRLQTYQENHGLEVVSKVKGKELVGRKYEPLFPYFTERANEGAFVVLADEYVATDEGTGVVHQAPAFGEDDQRIALEHGITTLVCPVTMNGEFTAEVSDFAGQHVKEADRDIIRWLRDRNALLEHTTIQHNYPFCYRSDTPLIYRAVPSWFVNVGEFKDRLIAANQQVRWVPEHIRDGRFGHWLENARDWAISRNRVWGTPLPIWENTTTGNFVCIGSREELREYTGAEPVDLHREHVDDLTFAIDGEEGEYRRVSEVLDCWFESGSMPYAQQHYPFENAELFERGFPADFIAEGLDQTRGWFYTLMALSSAIHDQPAFKNVIVNGMVLAEDGRKMSKHLKNYTDPVALMEKYGADALRLYLINSGLMRAEEQRFVDSGVEAIVRRALLPWYNAFSFFKLYAEIDGWSHTHSVDQIDNILDRWLISKLQTLKSTISREMEAYRLYGVVPRLFEFIEDLNNGYIRLNRSRFWGDGLDADKKAAYSTLYQALLELTQAMAPCAPFLAEYLFHELRKFGDATLAESVHLCHYPVANDALVDAELESAVRLMQQVILLGRRQREERKINLRVPLSRLTIIHRDEVILNSLRKLESYIITELNVKHVYYESNEAEFIKQYAKPNFPVLGKRLGKRMKAFQRSISSLSVTELETLRNDGALEIDGETFSTDEIQVFREAIEGSNVVTDRLISIELDTEINDELALEGLARELVHRIQLARKAKQLQVTDRIDLFVDGTQRVLQALDQHRDYIVRETLTTNVRAQTTEAFVEDLDGEVFRFDLERREAA